MQKADDFVLEIKDLLGEKVNKVKKLMFDEGGEGVVLGAIPGLGKLSLQGVIQASELAKSLDFRAGRLPGGRMLSFAERGNQEGVNGISLGAFELALSIGFGTGRVDDTNDMTDIVQMRGNAFGIGIGGFHASMHF